MRIFTRRNALVGWIALRIARRRFRRRLNAGKRRWGMLAGAGVAAAATAGTLYARREHAAA